jgi:hypothetical protein
MPWVAGQSGNPNGRPPEYNEVKALARKWTKPALRRLAHIMRHGETEGACVAAAIALLDRGWGKPSQEITGKDGGPIELAAFLTDARARRQAALEGPLIEAIAHVVADDATPVVQASQPNKNNGLGSAEPPISAIKGGTGLRKRSEVKPKAPGDG